MFGLRQIDWILDFSSTLNLRTAQLSPATAPFLFWRVALWTSRIQNHSYDVNVLFNLYPQWFKFHPSIHFLSPLLQHSWPSWGWRLVPSWRSHNNITGPHRDKYHSHIHIYGQFTDANQNYVCVFGTWEEAGVPGEDQCWIQFQQVTTLTVGETAFVCLFYIQTRNLSSRTWQVSRSNILSSLELSKGGELRVYI